MATCVAGIAVGTVISCSDMVTDADATIACSSAQSAHRDCADELSQRSRRVPIHKITILPWIDTISRGETLQLVAQPKDNQGRLLDGREVTWSTLRPAVATVSGSGLVTGISDGVATIVATSEGKEGYAAIHVRGSSPGGVASVTINPASAAVQAGSTTQLTATARDAQGNVVSGQTFSWASSNANVAGVSASGLVAGVGAGSATITASTGGVSGRASVTVTSPTPVVARITIAPSAPSVQVGNTVQLTATAHDANGNVVPGQTFAWSSSSIAVASVSASGLVTGNSAGTATVRAVTGGVSATTSVTVTSPAPVVAQVSVAPQSTTLAVGGTTQLTATARDANGNAISGQSFTWTSSNSAVASVSSSGNVTGAGPGSATITAQTSGVTGTANITVTSPPTGQNRVIFFSDWRTARGNSLAAVSDGGKWDFISADYNLSMEIVASTGLDFPSANVFRVIAEPRRQGWAMPRKTGLPIPAIGESRFYRWYFRSTQPDGLEDYQTHPVQDGFAASNSNWMFININGGSANVPAGQWQPQFWAYVAPYPNQRWYGPNLNKNQTYRFEVQIHRVSANQFQMHVRVYNSGGTLIASDANFRNYDQGATLATNPTFPFHNVNNLDGLNAGNNGIGGNPPFPFTYAYEGAFAVCADTWCGAYNGSF